MARVCLALRENVPGKIIAKGLTPGRAEDDSLVQTQTPVNQFPDFLRYAVQQIKLFCPTLGKGKISDALARAGIHNDLSAIAEGLGNKTAAARWESKRDAVVQEMIRRASGGSVDPESSREANPATGRKGSQSEELRSVRQTEKVGRNDSCPCGSGKKYKKCCMRKRR